MSITTSYILLAIIAILLVPLYRQLATKLGLYDVPNKRSSHTHTTLRGAGIILLITFLLGQLIIGNWHPYLSSGLFIGAATGFADDKYQLSAKIRAFLYAFSVFLCLFAIPDIQAEYHWVWIVAILLVSIGTVNAYNFMDGINGISILYTIVFVITAMLIETWDKIGMDVHLMVFVLIGSVVLGYMNIRKKALAFMGDVGSVFLGLLIVYWMVYLITFEDSIIFLSMLLVYGIDSVITIAERLVKKENIFSAHRSHLYQLLSNELKWSHVSVSVLYAVVQASINAFMIYAWYANIFGPPVFFSLAILFGILYLTVKYAIVYPKIKRLHTT